MKVTREDINKRAGFDTEDEAECLAAVEQNSSALQYVRNQTPEICMAAVKQNGRTLQYVHDQTPEICMAAVKQDGWALEFVRIEIGEDK